MLTGYEYRTCLRHPLSSQMQLKKTTKKVLFISSNHFTWLRAALQNKTYRNRNGPFQDQGLFWYECVKLGPYISENAFLPHTHTHTTFTNNRCSNDDHKTKIDPVCCHTFLPLLPQRPLFSYLRDSGITETDGDRELLPQSKENITVEYITLHSEHPEDERRERNWPHAVSVYEMATIIRHRRYVSITTIWPEPYDRLTCNMVIRERSYEVNTTWHKHVIKVFNGCNNFWCDKNGNIVTFMWQPSSCHIKCHNILHD